MGITNTVRFLQELGVYSVEDLITKAAKKSLNKLSGRTRFVFKGEELQALGLEGGFGNIKHPRLVIGANNSQGQSLWGATVCDASGKPVQSFAVSYDVTRGKNPVYQMRSRVFDGNKKIFSVNEYADTNISRIPDSDIRASISHNRGITTASIDAGQAYHKNITAPSINKAAAFWMKTNIGLADAKVVEAEVKALSNANELKPYLDWLKKSFKAKDPIVKQKLAKVSKMDLKAVDKELNLQTAQMEKIEVEFDKLYTEIFGTSEKIPNWKEHFYVRQTPTTNPITGEALSKKTITRINKKMQKYSDVRRLLVCLRDRKQVLTGLKYVDEKFISKMFEELNITIGKTTDEVMIKELRALRGLPKEEILEKSKDIICKKAGIPPELIKLSPAPEGYEIGVYSASFEETQGRLYYHPTILNAPDDMLIGAIRHEIDHLEVMAKTAKAMGLDNYKTLVCKTEKKLAMFDKENLEKIIEHVNTDGFDAEPYIKAMSEYVTPFGSIKNTIKYFSNPLELRAYQAGLDIELALNGGNIAISTSNQLVVSRLCSDIQKHINEIQKIAGENVNLDSYISNIGNQALNMVENPGCQNYIGELFNKILFIVKRDLQNLKAGAAA